MNCVVLLASQKLEEERLIVMMMVMVVVVQYEKLRALLLEFEARFFLLNLFHLSHALLAYYKMMMMTRD